MHGLHARLGKNFNLYDRLVRYNKAIVENPKHIRGHWRQWCAPCTYDEKRQRFVQSAFREVHLDLGCGKAIFVLMLHAGALMFCLLALMLSRSA